MPFFKISQPTTVVEGNGWQGRLTAYQGVVPNESKLKLDYLLLCIANDDLVLTVALTAHSEMFKLGKDFYRWLLTQHVHLFEVIKVHAD